MIRINNTQYFHFLQQADVLRRSGSLCDVVISVKSQIFRAHQLVLACASRTLAQQFTQVNSDSPRHCSLDCLSPHTFQQVLDFIYTLMLDVSEEDLHQLLRAAQLLEMKLLEEQCRKQLDSLAKEEDSREEISDGKADKCTNEAEKKGNSGQEGAHQDTPSPSKEVSIVVENISPPASPRKKLRLSPMSTATFYRDSVITRPVTAMSSLPPPWTFPTNMWNSVRQIAENYSSFIATHSPQPTNQHPSVYPITISPPHVLPLLGQSAHRSLMSCSSFHPRYKQHLYTGSAGIRDIIKQGLLKKRQENQSVFTGTDESRDLSYPDVPKASRERVKDCQRCSHPASTPPGEACAAACRFYKRRHEGQREPQSHRQDHRGEKPYQCHHCPKKFSLKHQLDTHHRVHTGEKPFECRLCGQRSRDYSAMIKHLRTHGGAAPYQCTVCQEFCSSLVAMQKHIKNHSVQDFPPDWNISSTYLYTSHI